jgi:hypothetical protein
VLLLSLGASVAYLILLALFPKKKEVKNNSVYLDYDWECEAAEGAGSEL